jgi:hypothetical protein
MLVGVCVFSGINGETESPGLLDSYFLFCIFYLIFLRFFNLKIIFLIKGSKIALTSLETRLPK